MQKILQFKGGIIPLKKLENHFIEKIKNFEFIIGYIFFNIFINFFWRPVNFYNQYSTPDTRNITILYSFSRIFEIFKSLKMGKIFTSIFLGFKKKIYYILKGRYWYSSKSTNYCPDPTFSSGHTALALSSPMLSREYTTDRSKLRRGAASSAHLVLKNVFQFLWGAHIPSILCMRRRIPRVRLTSIYSWEYTWGRCKPRRGTAASPRLV